MTSCLRTLALQALTLSDPQQKCQQVALLWQAKHQADPSITLSAPAQSIPGRPEKPTLVPPKQLQRRAMNTAEGRAALIHALAHIEFNAINLALDAVWRFADMPADYYLDWLQVAKEEAYHFSLLRAHLLTLGFDYGDFDGHNSLWEMVEKNPIRCIGTHGTGATHHGSTRTRCYTTTQAKTVASRRPRCRRDSGHYLA